MKKIKLVLETGEEFIGESIGFELEHVYSPRLHPLPSRKCWAL